MEINPDGICVICETFPLLICEKSAYLRNLRETSGSVATVKKTPPANAGGVGMVEV